MTAILKKEQYMLIYRASYFPIFVILYALYKQHYDNAILSTCICLTSINYWRYPDYSWRRYLDMAVVKSGLIYQIYYSYHAQYATLYYILTGIGVFSYPIGVYYYRKGDWWASTYSHLTLHLFANMCNLILYSGYIRPQLK